MTYLLGKRKKLNKKEIDQLLGDWGIPIQAAAIYNLKIKKKPNRYERRYRTIGRKRK